MFACELCDRQYSLKHNLNRHIRSHSKNIKCNQCGKMFSRKDVYKRHIKNMHVLSNKHERNDRLMETSEMNNIKKTLYCKNNEKNICEQSDESNGSLTLQNADDDSKSTNGSPSYNSEETIRTSDVDCEENWSLLQCSSDEEGSIGGFINKSQKFIHNENTNDNDFKNSSEFQQNFTNDDYTEMLYDDQNDQDDLNFKVDKLRQLHKQQMYYHKKCLTILCDLNSNGIIKFL